MSGVKVALPRCRAPQNIGKSVDLFALTRTIPRAGSQRRGRYGLLLADDRSLRGRASAAGTDNNVQQRSRCGRTGGRDIGSIEGDVMANRSDNEVPKRSIESSLGTVWCISVAIDVVVESPHRHPERVTVGTSTDYFPDWGCEQGPAPEVGATAASQSAGDARDATADALPQRLAANRAVMAANR